MNSFTNTNAQTFSEIHAKKLASKVATDLKRMQRFYGSPSDSRISNFEIEIIELLKKGYLGTVTYGFKKNGDWIPPTVRYTARDLAGMESTDDDPGRIPLNANIDGATFSSFLSYNSTWDGLSSEEQDKFEKTLPFQRTGGDAPGVNGYFSSDKSYSSGGKALDRSSLKNN